MRAFYRDRNLWISASRRIRTRKQITTDGDEKKRTKNGSGSWVYGEELGQTTAIWWSPDSTQVAFYRFDESPVKDFYPADGRRRRFRARSTSRRIRRPARRIRSPKCSSTTSRSGRTTKLDVRDGKPFTDIPADGSKFANDAPGTTSIA